MVMLEQMIKSVRNNWARKIKKNSQSLILIAITVLLGVASVILSKATTSSVSIEPENGTKCSPNLQKSGITGASNNSHVKFATNVCASTGAGGEDVRGVMGELAEYPSAAGLVNQWLQPWSPADPPNGEGAFRFQCKPSHLIYDDPIVNPGQPGASHLHLFYGNETANGNSTYESLRKNGTGTCEGGAINRSAYWIPALINGSNKVILPDYTQVYYKVRQSEIPKLSYIPRGLRYIAGNPMNSGATEAQVYGPYNPDVPGNYYQSPIWKCYDSAGAQRNQSDRIPQCQDGDSLYAAVPFPFCWNKDKIIDSNNHRTHVVFPDNYENICPASHPFHIPEFTIITKWSIRTGDAAQMGNWYLSSDRHGAMTYPNGKSLHADWFGAWDDVIMKRWIDNCLKGYQNANNANMCDGQAGKRPSVPVNGSLVPWYENHPNRLVDVPAHP